MSKTKSKRSNKKSVKSSRSSRSSKTTAPKTSRAKASESDDGVVKKTGTDGRTRKGLPPSSTGQFAFLGVRSFVHVRGDRSGVWACGRSCGDVPQLESPIKLMSAPERRDAYQAIAKEIQKARELLGADICDKCELCVNAGIATAEKIIAGAA